MSVPPTFFDGSHLNFTYHSASFEITSSSPMVFLFPVGLYGLARAADFFGPRFVSSLYSRWMSFKEKQEVESKKPDEWVADLEQYRMSAASAWRELCSQLKIFINAHDRHPYSASKKKVENLFYEISDLWFEVDRLVKLIKNDNPLTQDSLKQELKAFIVFSKNAANRYKTVTAEIADEHQDTLLSKVAEKKQQEEHLQKVAELQAQIRAAEAAAKPLTLGRPAYFNNTPFWLKKQDVPVFVPISTGTQSTLSM